ncbi:hypothetical protein LS280_001107 [Campylobacter jejuni]|nr:hypothetical protein [Campylobacter jejuni]
MINHFFDDNRTYIVLDAPLSKVLNSIFPSTAKVEARVIKKYFCVLKFAFTKLSPKVKFM